MSPRLLPPLAALALVATGCRDACEQECFALDEFYEACEDDLEAAGYPMACVDEGVEAYPDGTIDREHSRECDDGRDARQSCLRMSHARAEALTPSENEARVAQCAEETTWDEAVVALDCEGAIEALRSKGH
jgi:hypothetical protein